jgi:hypothetical protein
MQPIIHTLWISDFAFVCILICIPEFCYLSSSDQLPSTLTEWEMTWPYHAPTHLASNLRHVDRFTSYGRIYLNFLTSPYPDPSPPFPSCTISNVKYLNHVHKVCAESYIDGSMDGCSMTVVVQTDLPWALTSLSVTCMISRTSMLSVYIVNNIAFDWSLNSHLQIEIERVGYLTAWFGFWHFHIVRLTLAHAQMNHHVSQYGHWNQE